MTPSSIQQRSRSLAASVFAESPRHSRLVAVRWAGAAFDGPSRLRDRAFEDLLDTWQALVEELERRRAELVDALYRAVPQADGKKARGRLLQLKRDVFNGRVLTSLPDGLPAVLRRPLEDYAHLTRREAELFSRHRADVVQRQRRDLAALLRRDRFPLSCRYASPDLMEELDQTPGGLSGVTRHDYLTLERGLYTFAARFISKANPLHLFADLAFPPDSPLDPDDRHEIVLDTTIPLRLEELLLKRDPEDPDPPAERIQLQLRPFLRHGRRLQFWIPQRSGFRLEAVEADEGIERLLEFFDRCQRWRGRPTGSRQDWLDFTRPAAAQELAGYVARGLVAEYLVTDLNHFAAALRGLDDTLDPQIDALEKAHLGRFPLHRLRAVDHSITDALESLPSWTRRGTDTEPRTPYFVNSYRPWNDTDWPEDYQKKVHEIARDLAAVKPLFLPESNFAGRDATLRAYLLDYLAHRDGGGAPYLEVLRHFLRHRGEILERYRLATPAAERARKARLAKLRGRLAPDRLRELVAELPATKLPLPRLCFNGPFDPVDGVYHPTNVFAGDERFLSRYLLHRDPVLPSKPADDGSPLDVELAVPPWSNLNYVVRRFATGCGFESRYSHGYDRWIPVHEVHVEAEGGHVVHRHGPDGRRLRFHYRGFLLASYLPEEYQLLLAAASPVAHGDFFHNPFTSLPGAPEGDEWLHQPGLSYGSIRLRRERWLLGPDCLSEVDDGEDPLRYAAELRRALHTTLGTTEDLWYYRLLGGGRRDHKPRFLDLRNPLSVHAARRHLPPRAPGALVLTPMLPPPEHLLPYDGSATVSEWMIEV